MRELLKKDLSELDDDQLLQLLDYVSDEVKVRNSRHMAKYAPGFVKAQFQNAVQTLFDGVKKDGSRT